MVRLINLAGRHILALSVLASMLGLGLSAANGAGPSDAGRPNILWLTSEDNGPHLGCFGDAYASTPQLDRLASQGIRYLHCCSNAPVCAPARTAIITGMYPPALGAQHMRSMVRLPRGATMFPKLLREAGYYCTNNRKEDYNVEKPAGVWDESSRTAHWKNRPAGRPFFAVFNHTVSHESQIRARPHTLVHDPRRVSLPPYHPDTPEVRHDWAQYYDKLTEMDAQVGEKLRELADAGLQDDTIVFYFSDHGSGMPRSKRWLYTSGLHVPLIVRIPEKFAHLQPAGYLPGGTDDRLVGFVDLAPTVLSLAGIEAPELMHGTAFLGKYAGAARAYQFGFRDRMDERYDLSRSVSDTRFLYLRNYMPHREYGQYLSYMFQMPTTRVWKALFDRGELSPPRTYFWKEKPAEELYDIQSDPHQVRNLVNDSRHAAVLNRLRSAHRSWVGGIRDLGFLPESEIHGRSGDGSPYEMGHDEARYPLARIVETADLAASRDLEDLPCLVRRSGDSDSAVRYWAAVGLLVRGATAASTHRKTARRLLQDSAWPVRITAAEVLVRHGDRADVDEALDVLLDGADVEKHGLYVSIHALNALDMCDAAVAAQAANQIRAIRTSHPSVPKRMGNYLGRLVDKILVDMQ